MVDLGGVLQSDRMTYGMGGVYAKVISGKENYDERMEDVFAVSIGKEGAYVKNECSESYVLLEKLLHEAESMKRMVIESGASAYQQSGIVAESMTGTAEGRTENAESVVDMLLCHYTKTDLSAQAFREEQETYYTFYSEERICCKKSGEDKTEWEIPLQNQEEYQKVSDFLEQFGDLEDMEFACMEVFWKGFLNRQDATGLSDEKRLLAYTHVLPEQGEKTDAMYYTYCDKDGIYCKRSDRDGLEWSIPFENDKQREKAMWYLKEYEGMENLIFTAQEKFWDDFLNEKIYGDVSLLDTSVPLVWMEKLKPYVPPEPERPVHRTIAQRLELFYEMHPEEKGKKCNLYNGKWYTMEEMMMISDKEHREIMQKIARGEKDDRVAELEFGGLKDCQRVG